MVFVHLLQQEPRSPWLWGAANHWACVINLELAADLQLPFL